MHSVHTHPHFFYLNSFKLFLFKYFKERTFFKIDFFSWLCIDNIHNFTTPRKLQS